MTKRITQPSTVSVPATVANVQGDAAVATAKVAAVQADDEVKVDVAAVAVEDEADPVIVSVAVAAPAPLAMVDAAAAPLAAAAAEAAAQDAASDDEGSDATPYIVGGVLIAGGILAVALSGGEDELPPTPPAPPPPPPPPTNVVTISTAATATIAENAPVATTVIDVNATATQTGAITYTLGGTDAALFNIDAATGIITLRSSANFEARPTYSVTVTASSAGTPAASATQTIAITVTNVNEAPAFADAARTTIIAENIPAGSVVVAAGGATDPDSPGAGSTITYSLTGADAALFTINATTGAVTLIASPNFETRSSYSFNIVATDNANPALSTVQANTLTVTNVNEAPTIVVPTAPVAFAENGLGTVFTAVSSDVDAGATRTFSLTGPDAALFRINQTTGAVSFIAAPDFEAVPTRTTFTVSVVTTDQGGLATTSTPVTINLTDVPGFTGTAGNDVLIGTAAAEEFAGLAGDDRIETRGGADFVSTGAGRDVLVFSGDRFDGVDVSAPGRQVVGNEDTISDFSFANDTYQFNSRDFGIAGDVVFVSLDANAPGAVIPAGANVIVLRNSDNDGNLMTPFNAGTAATQVANIVTTDGAGFIVYYNSVLDLTRILFSSNLNDPNADVRIISRQSDLTGAGAIAALSSFTAANFDFDRSPVFTSAATATVAENQLAAFTAAAPDGDSSTILYTLSGADAALFTINATSGVVTFRAAPNFEAPGDAGANNVYDVTVTATDGRNSTTQNVAVTVTNVNEAPTFAATARTTTLAENVAAGASIVPANSATDPDAGGTLTYTLTGPDAALFAVNATTGAVTLIASPNFEARSSYSFNLVATDQAGLTVTQANTVTITNVNEAPTFTSGATATVAENVATSTVIYTAAATDPDAGSTVTFSLTGADAALFTINPTTGVVTLNSSPNFEARPSYSINVVATDNGNPALTTTQPVVVTVTNVNEAPTFAATTRTATLDENVAAGTVVPGSAVATDVDAGGTLTYSLTGADAARFAINAMTGVVTIVASPDFETRPTFAFNVVATDQGGLAATQAVTLNINDLQEGIVLVGVQNLSATPGNVQYLESAGTANTSTINNFAIGDTITVDVPTSSYSFSNNGADLVIQFANGGIVNQITLTGAVPANSIIFNEASAEAAVGSNFFLQQGVAPTPPPPAASNTIDGAGAQPTYNASNAAVTFIENAGAANTTTISNFTTDDRIVVNGAAAGSYSFTNSGADLVISFANGGIVNQITLTGAVNPNAIVFDEASAEAALGADFFRYA